MLKLIPGASPRDAAAALRERALEARNILGAAHTGGGMLRAYLQYALDSVRQLDNHFVASDVRRLIQTRRYWSLQSSTDGVAVDLIPSVILEEVSDKSRDLEAAALRLESDHARWQRGRLVVPDTSALIHGPKVWDWDPAADLGFRDSSVHIVVPIQVLDELDDLKEATKQHTRNRARRTLNWLNMKMGNQQSVLLRRGGAEESDEGLIVRGDVYLDVLLDDPGHQRLPIADDEIVDRAAAVEAVAGHAVTLVTNDHGQAYRAGFASIQVEMVKNPIYDIDEQERARRAKADAKQQQREQQAERSQARSQAESPAEA